MGRNGNSQFIHLRVHSAYSLSEGAVRIEEVPDLCRRRKMPAVALTDSGNLFGALEFAKTCAGAGVQPIMGCVVNIESRFPIPDSEVAQLVLLAKDGDGYRNLLRLVSRSYLEGADAHKPVVSWNMLAEHAGGLIALSGGPDGPVGKHLQNNNIAGAEKTLLALKELFPDRLYVELMRHGLESESRTEKPFVDLAYKHDLPLVATNDAYFPVREMHEAHDALICVADGRFVAEADRRRFTPEHYFKSPEEMASLFADMPEAIANTVAIARRCAVMPEPRAPMLPSYPAENGRSEEEELRLLAREGLERRLGLSSCDARSASTGSPALLSQDPAQARSASQDDAISLYLSRLEYELDVISGMKFPGYFLIVSDFIRWSKRQGIPVGPGRGSGAGSLVAWALEITDLDPIRFGLLFERFLNPERVSMPDFDIDFCQERRDEVIAYVQRKYGADRVAQIITFGKLQARAVLRDVGRVLQMPYSQVDRICKMVPFNPLAPVTLSQAIAMDPELRREQQSDEQVAKLLDIGLKLEGLYRHASTHAAGLVIGSEPLTNLIPLYTDHRSPVPATQYSMKYAEMAGLVKFDFLGLKTLTVIDQACKLIRAQGAEIDMASLPLDDAKTYALLATGEAAGLFQMESAGMRDALRKMKPDCIGDIIALISLYRPGPMENIPTYIARKHGRERPDYPHPKLEACLKETFGVIIYQEQVMEIARILAGYSLAAADLLRRAMGKKIKSEMDAQREQFVSGAVRNGVGKAQASEIFDLVAKFAGYGFNKSHAAAYAAIGYQTAWLKANYPVEFLVACMNIDIGDTDKLGLYREEARRLAIRVLPPDINASGALFAVERAEDGGKAIRYALGALRNVGAGAMKELEALRAIRGRFKDIFDVAEACGKIVNKRQLESLAKSGAFDSVHPSRRQAFEGASVLVRHAQSAEESRNSGQHSLFGAAAESASPSALLPDVKEWTGEERLAQEYDAVGFYLSAHPLDAYRTELERMGVTWAAKLEESSGGRRQLAGAVTRVVHRANSQRKRFCYVHLSDPTGAVEISVFNEDLINSARELLQEGKLVLVTVEARKDEGGVRLQAEAVAPVEAALNNRETMLTVHLANADNINALRDYLAALPRGCGRVFLNLTVPAGDNVEIELPQRYAFRPAAAETLAVIQGVAKISVA